MLGIFGARGESESKIFLIIFGGVFGIIGTTGLIMHLKSVCCESSSNKEIKKVNAMHDKFYMLAKKYKILNQIDENSNDLVENRPFFISMPSPTSPNAAIARESIGQRNDGYMPMIFNSNFQSNNIELDETKNDDRKIDFQI
jgi:hypothetical protein